MRCLAPFFFALSVTPALACETALLLAIDVSNSVDAAEYRLQTDGFANALRDPAIMDIMLRDRVAVVQWSGVDEQVVAIPWERISHAGQLDQLSRRARTMDRAFVLSGTATAEALLFSLAQFDAVADCKRKVIDISTDGTANAGSDVRLVRGRAERAGVTINGIGIESMGRTITNFLHSAVITRDGFVMAARMHQDYPAAIRAKILREIARVMG